MSLDPVDLAAELIRFDTINPPGQEAACTDYLARLLTGAGFHCETVLLAEGRPNLVARIGGSSRQAADRLYRSHRHCTARCSSLERPAP